MACVELRETERTDERDGNGVPKLRINPETEENVRLIRHMTTELLHDALDFDKGERFATGDMHKFAPTDARYVRITMLKNSANSAVHLVELRVFEVGK